MDSNREQHFILNLMDFVYELSGKPLQSCLKLMLSEYPKKKASYFSENVTQAILIYIIDFMDSNEKLVELASPAYQVLTEELSKVYSPFNFLKFLAHYAAKSRIEYYDQNLLDSPIKFFSSIVRFLEDMKKKDRLGVEFWERLEEAAVEVVAKDLKIIKAKNRKLGQISNEVDMTNEKEFILVISNFIYGFCSKKLPDYLRQLLDKFMLRSQNVFDPNIEIALKKAKRSLERNIAFLGDDEAIYEYFFGLATKNFNGRHFLEFSVCSTIRALSQYYHYDVANSQAPLRAFNRLVHVLQLAKQNYQFDSMKDFIEGAHEIIDDYNKREDEIRKQRAERDNIDKTYTDNSSKITDPNSNYENLIAKCDCLHSSDCTRHLNKIASKRNNRTDNVNVFVSGDNAQLTTVNVILWDKKDHLNTENVASTAMDQPDKDVVLSGNDQPDKDVVLSGNDQPDKDVVLSGIDQPRAEDIVPSKDDNPCSGNIIVSDDNDRRNTDDVVVSGRNAQLAAVDIIVSRENTQLAKVNVIISGENSQLASVSTIVSGESAQLATVHVVVSNENNETGRSIVYSGEKSQTRDE